MPICNCVCNKINKFYFRPNFINWQKTFFKVFCFMGTLCWLQMKNARIVLKCENLNSQKVQQNQKKITTFNWFLFFEYIFFFSEPKEYYTRGCVDYTTLPYDVTYGQDQCIRVDIGDVHVEGCICFKDLCNSSPIIMPTVFLTLVAVLATFCNLNYWSIVNAFLNVLK